MAGGPKDSSPPSRLTPLQVALLQAFFAREQRFVLTGGAALAGFYFGHRETEDLDFFGPPGLDLQEAARTLEVACAACAASLEPVQTFPDFRRHGNTTLCWQAPPRRASVRLASAAAPRY